MALNNAEAPATAAVPTFMARGDWERVYGEGPARIRSGRDGRLTVTVGPLSAVVYRAKDRIERSRKAPPISLTTPASGSDRLEVRANVAGDSNYAVTFFARRPAAARWQDIGTDDNAPYRVFHDVADLTPGTRVEYRAVVLDNARHERESQTARSTIAPPAITLEAPTEGQRVRGSVEVRATTVPEQSYYVVAFERSVNGGPFTRVGTDDSSPVYTVFDDTSSLPDGARVTYRAVLTYAPGRTVTSATRTATIVQARVETATIHYKGDAVKWGLHLFGDGLAPGEATAEWTNPTPFNETDAYGSLRRIQLADDTKRIGFIVHGRPPTDPNLKDTPNDRFFTPLATPEIWLREGDATIYSCAAADASCVVPG